MSTTMMTLGNFQFSIDTAAYQGFKREDLAGAGQSRSASDAIRRSSTSAQATTR